MTEPDRQSPDAPSATTPSGLASERGNAASTDEVGAMFDRISGVYDVMNAVISGFQEPRWRRRAVAMTEVGPGGAVIDVATGTVDRGALGPRINQRLRRAHRLHRRERHDLDALAREQGCSVIAGAGFAPGLTGLLARHGAIIPRRA